MKTKLTNNPIGHTDSAQAKALQKAEDKLVRNKVRVGIDTERAKLCVSVYSTKKEGFNMSGTVNMPSADRARMELLVSALAYEVAEALHRRYFDKLDDQSIGRNAVDALNEVLYNIENKKPEELLTFESAIRHD